MIGTDEADRSIRETLQILPEESVPLDGAHGRVLRENVVANRDLPPYDRVMMDGIALSHAAFRSGRRSFEIRGEVAAGHPTIDLPEPAEDCIEVMTGAVLPPGSDCVIPVEDVEIGEGQARLTEGLEVRPGQFIHRQGSDRRQGEILLHAGCRLNAARIGIVASAGCAALKASRRPVIGIVSNGDELVEVGQAAEPHQIHPSNRYALRAALLQSGIEELRVLHLPDNASAIERDLRKVLEDCDVTILSGGVSAGAYDYIPGVLDRLGVRRIFHKVRQRPGKPMWFGLTDRGRPVFALPGNPTSTFVCFYRYVLPHLERMMGLKPRIRTAILVEAMSFASPLTGFVPVREIESNDGHIQVEPIDYRGSGDVASLDRGTGFVELGAEQKEFPSGTVVPYYPWV